MKTTSKKPAPKTVVKKTVVKKTVAKLNPGQMIVKSLDAEGRTVDPKLFDSGIRGLKKLFGRTDDFFSIEMYLVDEGLDEDWASEIVNENF